MNFEPAAAASSNCAAVRIVPAPTTASGTSAATRRIDSSAAGVRKVISIARRPPRPARGPAAPRPNVVDLQHRDDRLAFQQCEQFVGLG